MKDITTGPINVNEYGRLNAEFLQELAIVNQEQTNFDNQDIEENDDNHLVQRMPQFRLNERRSKSF